jgi:CxxC motif-containing protein
MKSRRVITCIVCPRGCRATLEIKDNKIKGISGLKCSKGKDYIRREAIHPVRILFTTIPIEKAKNISVLPVRTEKPISKDLLNKGMEELAKVKLKAPLKIGDVIAKDFMRTGINVISSRSVKSEEI